MGGIPVADSPGYGEGEEVIILLVIPPLDGL